MNTTDIVPFASLEEALKEKKISLRTFERVKIAKSYIEKKYKMKREEEEEKRKDWDLIMTRMEELQVPQEEAEKIKKDILHREGEQLRMKRQKINIRDFESIAIIGKGAFGEVRVCRYKPTGEVVAIKKMKKDEMHKKNQVLHVREEQLVLSEAKNPWIVDLKYSFQDDYFLYLVMEFLPGGDLMSLLMTKDILTEDESRFYAAELILAIESVHKLNCIHRDLKPDNVLIDQNGHIKLSDFGLSKKLGINLYDNEFINGNVNNTNEQQSTFGKNLNIKELAAMSKNRKRRIYAFSTVGTPDYIAPEVFSQKGYGPEVDWWSLGVILFEMLIGYPPFFSDSATDTCKMILNWKNNLVIPPESKISKDAVDLIKKLITDVDKRLGYNGAEEIKKHPFFKNLDWNNLNTVKPSFIPEIENEWDTKYFDQFEEEESFYPPESSNNNIKKPNKDICFVNFTYKRDMDNNFKSGIVSALEVLDSLKESMKKADNNNLLESLQEKEENGAYRSEIKNSIVINNNAYTNNDEEETLQLIKSVPHVQSMQSLNPIPSSNADRFLNFQNYKSNSNGLMNKPEENDPKSPKNNLIVKQKENGNSILSTNISKDLLKQASKIKKTAGNNISEQFFSNKTTSNLSNGNNNERLGGSDYLLKSNHDLEKKLKSNKTKTGNLVTPGSNPKSPIESKDKVKKINPIQINSNNTNSTNLNSPFVSNEYSHSTHFNNKIPMKKSPTIKIETPEQMSNTHEEFKMGGNSNKGIKKTTEKDKMPKISFNNTNSGLVFNNPQPGTIITTNYFKDFTNSESSLNNFSSAKSKESSSTLTATTNNSNNINFNNFNSKVSSSNTNSKIPQVKMNQNKDVAISMSKIAGDSAKPLSTKHSTGKKIVFTATTTSNLNNVAYNTNSSTGNNVISSSNHSALGQIQQPNKFLKMKDTITASSKINKKK